MNRRLHLLLLLVLLAVLLAASSDLPPAQAVPRSITLIVDDNGLGADANTGDGLCATSEGLCTLQAAVEESNADGQQTIIGFSQRFQNDGHISIPSLTISDDDTIIDGTIASKLKGLKEKLLSLKVH